MEYNMAEVTDFIDQVLAQDFSKAAPTFNDIIGDKMSDALEAEKINVAAQIFNGVEEQENEDQYELDLDDPEVEDEDDGEEEFTEYEFDDAAEEAMEEEDDEEEDFSDEED